MVMIIEAVIAAIIMTILERQIRRICRSRMVMLIEAVIAASRWLARRGTEVYVGLRPASGRATAGILSSSGGQRARDRSRCARHRSAPVALGMELHRDP